MLSNQSFFKDWALPYCYTSVAAATSALAALSISYFRTGEAKAQEIIAQSFFLSFASLLAARGLDSLEYFKNKPADIRPSSKLAPLIGLTSAIANVILLKR